MSIHSAWLDCMVSPGQFTGEYAISSHDHVGGQFSLFVDSSFVEHECGDISEGVECEGRVQVMVLEEKQGLALIKLPGRTFANGSTLTVKSSQLEAIETSQI